VSLYRDEGIVLRTHKLGEADRIVVLLTLGRGKVRAVAKGIRKTRSRFGGRLEPPGNVSLLLYEGRQLDIISQAESIDHYRAIHDDLGRTADALAMIEVVDQVAQEGEANPALYRMLQGALKTLATSGAPLLVAGFYWKLLALEGVAPTVGWCVGCGAGGHGDAVEMVALDPVAGGTLCAACRPVPGSRRIDAEAVELIRRILNGDLRSALAAPVSPATAVVADLATTWMEQHLERRLRALRMLDRAH